MDPPPVPEHANLDASLKSSFDDGPDPQRSSLQQKETELKEMQDQMESYTQMVKQLTSQREMAIKKLADMDIQISELNRKLASERVLVESKDKDLKSKQSQLQVLKDEEDQVKEALDSKQREVSATKENLSAAISQESQIKNKLDEFKQFISMTNAAIEDIDKAINIKDTIQLSALSTQTLTPPQLSFNSFLTNGMKSSSPIGLHHISADVTPSSHTTAHGQRENFTGSEQVFQGDANFDPFGEDDPFAGEDPFKSDELNVTLPDDDPFNPSSSSASNRLAISQDDPFAPTGSRGGF